MPDLVRLSDADVETRRVSLPGWELRDNALYRELTFRDFVDAFGLMTAVALIAERMGHHPEWSNVYNRVTIRLSTHDVDGISENDFTLASAISELCQRFTAEAKP
jgi:4a-hydroxytetrahydrobiopterin dehydratase